MEETVNKIVKARDEIIRELNKKEKEKEELINKLILDKEIRFKLHMMDIQITSSRMAIENLSQAIRDME
jgi:hypothetical protein